MEQDKLNKIIEVAKLYYLLDLNQQEIATKLGFSRPTVARYLQKAKEMGIVRITINDPTEDCEQLALDLQKAFQLKEAIIAPIPEYEDSYLRQALGEKTAEYLHRIVKNGDILALTWGRTLYQVARELKHKPVKDVTVVQLKGGISYLEDKTYASEILYLFGKAYNTIPYLLPLPAIVDHVAVKQAIMADRHIHKVLELGKEANIAVFSVGAPNADSLYRQLGYLSEEDLQCIAEKAVGDICSRFFDAEGGICLPDLNERTIGIELDELKKKERAILVAGGSKKVDAIYGALRGHYANVLITDIFTAKALLEKKKQEKQT